MPETRAEALADGVLVDVTPIAKEAGFKVPTAVTAAVFNECIEWTQEDANQSRTYQDQAGRLWDVLHLAAVKARSLRGRRQNQLLYELRCTSSASCPDRATTTRASAPSSSSSAPATTPSPSPRSCCPTRMSNPARGSTSGPRYTPRRRSHGRRPQQTSDLALQRDPNRLAAGRVGRLHRERRRPGRARTGRSSSATRSSAASGSRVRHRDVHRSDERTAGVPRRDRNPAGVRSVARRRRRRRHPDGHARPGAPEPPGRRGGAQDPARRQGGAYANREPARGAARRARRDRSVRPGTPRVARAWGDTAGTPLEPVWLHIDIERDAEPLPRDAWSDRAAVDSRNCVAPMVLKDPHTSLRGESAPAWHRHAPFYDQDGRMRCIECDGLKYVVAHDNRRPPRIDCPAYCPNCDPQE